MRKLRLDIDMLMVESFATDDGRGGSGTVRGHDDSTVVYPGGNVGRRSDDPADCSAATCGNLQTCGGMYSVCCPTMYRCPEPAPDGNIG